jgi:hypothetical protein
MTDFVVTATRLYVSEPDGRRQKFLRGDTITGLGEADVKRHLKAGNIAKPSDDLSKAALDDPEVLSFGETSTGEVSAPDRTGMPDPSASEIMAEVNSAPAVQLERPAKTARVETWRTYAIDSGAVAEDAAEGMDKAALVKAVEKHEDQ